MSDEVFQRLEGERAATLFMQTLKAWPGDGDELDRFVARASAWPAPKKRGAMRVLQKALEGMVG